MKVYWNCHVRGSNEKNSVGWSRSYGKNLVDPNKVLSVSWLDVETHNKETE